MCDTLLTKEEEIRKANSRGGNKHTNNGYVSYSETQVSKTGL